MLAQAEATPGAAISRFSLGQILRRSARLRGSSLAIADIERELTWDAFEQRVMKLAGALRALGIKPGDRVAILARTAIVISRRCSRCRGRRHRRTVEFRLATPELGSILRDSGAEILVIDDVHQHLANELASTADLHHVVHAGTEPTSNGSMRYEALLDAAAPVPDAGRCGEDLAALFYTSGSTGEPKGVMHSHANIALAGLSSIPPFELDEDAVALIAGPLFHVGATGLCFPAMMAAASVVVLPRFEPAQVIETIERYRITNLTGVPTMLRMIADHPEARRRDLSSLRTVTFGGAPMPDSLLTKLVSLAPGVRFVHCYGMTETTASCSALPPRYVLAETRHLGKALSIGKALSSLDITILDAADQELGPGAIGEIAVRGPIVTKVIGASPKCRSARSVAAGCIPAMRYVDEDGFLYIVDRLKDMIITGGENAIRAKSRRRFTAFRAWRNAR